MPSGKWISKVIVAVILAQAIWALVVSLTNSLIVPALARVMGADPQSPLYLGKGDFNVPAIFSSTLELCLAGIVAVLLNHWSQSTPVRTRKKTVETGATVVRNSMPSISPSAPVVRSAEVNSAATTGSPQSIPVLVSTPVAPNPTSAVTQAKPPISQTAATPKPNKPKKPKEVYYNIVGEPINPSEDN